MDQGERRIRSLKLRSNDDALLLQARHRLQEAFRTATMPGLPPNAQVLIRHLDLGIISSGLSSVALAERIGAMMRHLAAGAVCVDHESHPDANVVWFSDALQAHVTLMLRLLAGGTAHEWYWHSLFAHLQPSVSSATMERLLLDLLQTPLKGVALSQLLRQVMKARRLTQLLPLVSESLAHRLIHAQGLSPIAVKHTGVEPAGWMIAAPRLSREWRDALRQAALSWGAENVRSRWLAWQVLLLQQPERISQHDSLQRIDVGVWLKAWVMAAAEPATEPDALAGVNQIPPSPSLDEGEEHAALNLNEVVSHGDTAFYSGKENDSPTHSPLYQTGEAREDLNNALHEQTNTNPHVPADIHPPFNQPDMNVVPFSRHAGLALIIPLLQRLGMNELLQNNDALIAHDLPRQLLSAIASRFHIAENDPQRLLFENVEPCADVALGAIQLPAAWQRLVTCSGRPLRQGEVMSLPGLINIMQLICACYLRRYCNLSLRTLVQRPGRVALTLTHWDVLFDINQIDLRLRRVALDSDPGWVAWLGRVVQFHYDSEGERHV